MQHSPSVEADSLINKSLLGLLIFLGTEIMFFAGLISAFFVLRAGSVDWPPSGQPRLPIAITGVNTLFLLFSGYTMYQSIKVIREGNAKTLTRWLLVTGILGIIFLGIQGYEWARLVKYGLTFTSSLYGITFYTAIGCHAFHVCIGMIILLVVIGKALGGRYSKESYTGVELGGVYWYFVVGIWPILYIFVYLV